MLWTPYEEKTGRKADFIVEYNWCPHEEVNMVKRFQGLRSDFCYDEDFLGNRMLCIIHPEFLDSEGRVILDKTIEAPLKGYANMWIILKERRSYHKERIEEGVIGWFMAGSRELAKATVIQVGSLHDC